MIRQAHTYLAGALSGSALIAAAVVAFIVLVSVQAVRDWPFAGLVTRDGTATAVSAGHPAAPGPARNPAGSTATATQSPADGSRQRGATAVTESGTATGDGTRATVSPVADSPAAHGADPGGSGSGQESTSPGSPSSAGGSQNTATKPAGSAGSGGNSGGGDSPAQSPSEGVGKTVGEAVDTVDQATGGVVGSTGAGKAVEETVESVAGPKSPVGEIVDKTVGGTVKAVEGPVGKTVEAVNTPVGKTVETVGGLLGAHR